ncbi:MAG: pyrroline-5-carboxylate reductase, partial [Sulfurimonas sp.]
GIFMITFIGNGNMALSIAKGLGSKRAIEVVGRDMAKLEAFEKNLGFGVSKGLLDGFDITDKEIVLCIKPYNVEEVAKKLKGKAKVIYSVLAGTTIEKLDEHFNSQAIVRVMPNLAADVGASITTLCGDESFKARALEIFDSIGKTLWLGSQKELDIATALGGSGPAYLALIAEALADGAVKEGLKREDAMRVTEGLFSGFAKLLEQNHPALLKDRVMSAGGTTAAGYSALEDGGVRSACMGAISKAYKRAKEL